MTFPSFDAFLASGRAPEEFDWDLDNARATLSVLDIRDWRSGSAPPGKADELEARVLERRTRLWRIAQAQSHDGQEESNHNTPFTMPLGPNTRASAYTLRSSDSSAPWLLPLQRIHISPFAIPTAMADLIVETPSELLMHMNDIFGTEVGLDDSLESFLAECIMSHCDVGTVYGYLRPWWRMLSSGSCSFLYIRERMQMRWQEDECLRLQARGEAFSTSLGAPNPRGSLILYHKVPPRRVWDLFSNRVLPYHTLSSPTIPENLWAVSHVWLGTWDRQDVWTTVNGCKWPVSLPKGASLDNIRIELLNMGAEYVFLDVLCLRQSLDEEETEVERKKEWELDVPTLGHVYRHDRYQTTVVYFNGLGRPFDIRRDVLDSPFHWFNRAWTLQETTLNWLPGGLSTALSGYADGPYFMKRMHDAQMALGLWGPRPPGFLDLLHAMKSRPGFAHKKPFDRVAALAYLLPCPTRPMYDESWMDAERAWDALVESMSQTDRLELLLFYPRSERVIRLPGFEDTHALVELWRPTWAQIMSDPRGIPGPAMKFAPEEVLQGPYYSRPFRLPGNLSGVCPFYAHSAIVIIGCYVAGDGLISIRRQPGINGPFKDTTNMVYDERYQCDVFMDLPKDFEFTMVGCSNLTSWVVGQSDGTFDMGGEQALDFRKMTVARMYDAKERDRLRESGLGRRRLVAYRDPPRVWDG